MRKAVEHNSRWIVLAAIFGVMLILNCLTLYYVDDYTYAYSFATGERITSIAQIPASMAMHCELMNGRVLGHSLAQLFIMLPKTFFNVVSELMYTAQIWLMYQISTAGEEKKPVGWLAGGLVLLMGAFIWYFVPAFGQVYLWISGSVNYLWAAVVSLAYLYQFMLMHLDRADGSWFQRTLPGQILWVIFGFITGAWLESLSFAAVGTGILVIGYRKLILKKKVPARFYLSSLTGMAGYLFMVTRPATLGKYASEQSLEAMWNHFVDAFSVYFDEFRILVILFAAVWILACEMKVERRYRELSLICVTASLLANFVMVLAADYYERSMQGTVMFMVLASAVLMVPLFGTRRRQVMSIISAAVVICAASQFFTGCNDVYRSYVKTADRIAYIEAERDAGNMTVSIPQINPETKYSAVYGLKDLDLSDPTSWPNGGMAKFYGVERVEGYYE